MLDQQHEAFSRRFKLLKQVGEDETSRTYKAADETFGRFLKLKILKENAGEAASLALQSEARKAASLKLPSGNIIDLGQTNDGRCFLVYEWDDFSQEQGVEFTTPDQELGFVEESFARPNEASPVARQPITPAQQAELERIKADAMNAAKKIAAEIDALPMVGSDQWKVEVRQVITELECDGLRAAWRHCVEILESMLGNPRAKRENYINTTLEKLSSKYGEESMQQHLLEAFREWSAVPGEIREYPKKEFYSNKQLALDLLEAISFGPDVYATAEEKAKTMQEYADNIVEVTIDNPHRRRPT